LLDYTLYSVNQINFSALLLSTASSRSHTNFYQRLLRRRPLTTAIGKKVLDNLQQLDKFLAGIQGRAYRMAQLATGRSEDALDLVQEAMFKLVEKYSDKPPSDWGPLFYRILHSRINDWHRRNGVRNRFRRWLGTGDSNEEDPIQTAVDENTHSPEVEVQLHGSMDKLQAALQQLPQRQQQAFLLRAWEGLNVKETALAMSCAEGSVKTHYSRAVHSLRASLGDHWP